MKVKEFLTVKKNLTNICDTRSQFHQRCVYSFCTHRSQKRKKRLTQWLPFLHFFGICTQKTACRTLMKLTPGEEVNNFQKLSGIGLRRPKIIKFNWLETFGKVDPGNQIMIWIHFMFLHIIFVVTFDHFEREKHFLRWVGFYLKLAHA